MRIAVTGSNGFIGSGICSEAVRAGHVVLGISRSSTPAEDFGGEYLQADVSDVIRPIKGLFQKTLPTAKQEIGPIALLHLDGDWYDSTRAILENLYAQTQPGAYLQIDDYGYWDGCRKAVEEFEAELGVKFAIDVIDSTGVCFRKAAP